MRPGYEYTSLTTTQDIRVLIIAPGRPQDAMSCQLAPTRLSSTEEAPRSPRYIAYDALSYQWGNEENKVPVTITTITPPQLSSFANVVVTAHAVHKHTHGKPTSQKGDSKAVKKSFYIRRNLHAALLQFRDTIDEVVLWADAICINQDDPIEKAHQVSRMNQIYGEADNVCIWLGIGYFDVSSSVVMQKQLNEHLILWLRF